jgi:hypothetical protein
MEMMRREKKQRSNEEQKGIVNDSKDGENDKE